MAFVDGMTPQKIRSELSAAVLAHVEDVRDQVIVEEREAAEDAANVSTEMSAIATTAAVLLNQYSGEGFPEGDVSAPVGAIYTDTAATAGAIRWIKTTGTGNTGWRVEYGDTGLRRVDTLFPGIDTTQAGHHGIYMRRVGDRVTIYGQGYILDSKDNFGPDLATTIGRPMPGYLSTIGNAESSTYLELKYVGNSSHGNMLNFEPMPPAGAPFGFYIQYETLTSWPITRPGLQSN